MRRYNPTMLELTTDRTLLLDWVGQQAEARGLPRPVWKSCSVIGQVRDGEVTVAVVYDEYRWPAISGHIVSDGSRTWATPGFIRAMFDYPFRQLECRRVSAPVQDGNVAAVEFLTRLGFSLEGRQRQYYANGADRLLFGILKEECRWI